MVWFTAAGLFVALRLHRGIRYEPKHPVGTLLRPWVPKLILVGLLTVIGVVCLAWPYDRRKKTTLLDPNVTRLPDTVVLQLDLEGSLEFVAGEELILETESWGAGFPKSSLANNRDYVQDGAEVTHEREGWFRVLHAHTRITLPPNRIYRITLGERVTALSIPPEKRDADAFAHVFLKTPLGSRLEGMRGRVVEEDFFGRLTHSFSY